MTDYTKLERELEELLLRRMVDGLGTAEAARLNALLAEVPDSDEDCYERLAALVMLASVDRFEPLPDHVRDRIVANVHEALPGK